MDLFSDADSAGPSTPAKVDIRTDPAESLNQLSFNKEFAERYLHNKQRAELHQLEEKYGKGPPSDGEDDDDASESSSEDETEDEDGEQLTAQIDAAVFRTLQKIRSKDASVYNSKLNIFEIEEQAARKAAEANGLGSAQPTASAKGKRDKKLTLQDYQRQRVQELIATAADPAQAIAEATMAPKASYMDDDGETNEPLLAPAQEQEELRKQVSKAFHEGVDGDDDLFTKRSANDATGSGTYRDSVLAALGEGADLSTLRSALGPLEEVGPIAVNGSSSATGSNGREEKRSKKSKNEQKKVPTEQEQLEQSNEDFLLDYILNQGWIDKSDANVPVKPKVEKALLRQRQAEAASKLAGEGEAVREDGDGGSKAYGRDWEAEAAELESEASFDSKAEAFETAYNFRFEQGDEAFVIPSYARNPKDSVRREDTTRKRKREERTSRKEEEKAQRMQELARLKNLKRIEIVDKLKKLKEATGSNVDGFDNLDLEKDFDPDEHDRAMQGAFDDQYYGQDDEEFDPDMEKPTWDDDINIDDILAEEAAHTKKGGKKSKKSGAGSGDQDDDDQRIEMDADFLDGDDDVGADGTGGAASAGGIEGIRAQLADAKLSKKDRKKLKKKLKAAEEKAAKRLAGAANRGDGVDLDEMDADHVGSHATSEAAPAAPLSEADRKQKARDMMDEYYKLDYEDMIGDLPTRFKYTQVSKSDFGMSPVEILLADDAQLNQVVGLKAFQPYRKGKSRPIDLGKRLHTFRSELKGYEPKRKGKADAQESGEREGAEPAKRMGKKERLRKKAAEQAAAPVPAVGGADKSGESERASKKARTA